jgi:2'-5' RNA ligase
MASLNPPRIRAFLAVNLSVAVTRKIAEEVDRLRKGVSAKVSWVAPANLHLTLRFLGSIDEHLIDGIAVRLKKVAARHPPFEARARGLGEFGGHVLWVGVDGGEALITMQREVEATMVELGFGREEKPFHPHITVGRVKDGAIGEWKSESEYGASQVGEIVVYESRTHKAGAEYIARARVALGKGD